MPLSFYQAREQILAAVEPLAMEKVALLDAASRAVAEDIIARQPLPAFDNSAMDGYAVRAEDCLIGAVLPVKGYLPAGGKNDCRVEPGNAVRIMTGAPIPQGADAIIPFEETEEGPGQIKILGKVEKGDHVRWQGEDVSPGDRVNHAAAGRDLSFGKLWHVNGSGPPEDPGGHPFDRG